LQLNEIKAVTGVWVAIAFRVVVAVGSRAAGAHTVYRAAKKYGENN